MKIIPAFIHRRIAHRPGLVSIVDNVGWLFFDKALRMVVGLFVGIWVARYLGPERFGQLNFATAFVGLFGMLATMGLQNIVVRDLVRNPGGKEETLGTAALIQFAGGLLAYGLVIAVIYWLKAEDTLTKTLVAIIGLQMLFSVSNIATYWFESQVKSKYTVWVQNSVFLIAAAMKVWLILNNAPLIAFAWVMMAQAGIVMMAMLLVLSMRGPKLLTLRASFRRAKKLLTDSWPLLLSGVAIMTYLKIDQIMLGQMVGDKAVGIYSVAVSLSEMWYFAAMAIVASVFPAILEAKKRSEKQYYARFQYLYDLLVRISIAIALPMTFLSSYIVKLLFGIEYAEAGPVLAIHIWAAVFVFLGVASSKWFIAENRQILNLQRTTLGAITNVGCNLLLIPRIGVYGAAIATVFSFGVAAMFSDLIAKETREMFFMKAKAFNPIRISF